MRSLPPPAAAARRAPAGARHRAPGLALGVLLALAPLLPGAANAQETNVQETNAGAPLVVGVKEAAPFALRDPGAEGGWSGITVELWRVLADEQGLDYTFEERDLEGLLAGVTDGSLDAGLGALTITAAREADFDFTHPFYSTGFAIAVADQNAGWWGVIRSLVSPQLLLVLLALCALLLAIGAAVWLLERRTNPEQFGGGARGLGNGFWWSAVTMTTVGYGDKAPVTPGGRALAVVWMFASLLLVSSFTAAIATALTVGQLRERIRGPQDLPRVSVATVAGSTSESYLQANRIGHRTYPSVPDGLRAVAEGEVDAMVYDAPLLQYLILTEFQGDLHTLEETFQPQEYGIALPEGSPLREELNQALLRYRRGSEWNDLLFRYLGE